MVTFRQATVSGPTDGEVLSEGKADEVFVDDFLKMGEVAIFGDRDDEGQAVRVGRHLQPVAAVELYASGFGGELGCGLVGPVFAELLQVAAGVFGVGGASCGLGHVISFALSLCRGVWLRKRAGWHPRRDCRSRPVGSAAGSLKNTCDVPTKLTHINAASFLLR